MQVDTPPKLLKRLAAAEGYLDLEMPTQALKELEAIEEPGPWEATVEYLAGEALVLARRFDEAIPRLKRAAALIPPQHRQTVWSSLSDCYAHRGDEELAQLTRMFANSPSAEVRGILELLNITVHLEDQIEACESPDSTNEGGTIA